MGSRLELLSREDDDQGSWIVAYADLITLLFIFFALVLSVSTISPARFDWLKDQMQSKQIQQPKNLAALQKEFEQAKAQMGLQDQVQTELGPEGLNVHFSDHVLFESASAGLTTQGQSVLSSVAQVLDGLPEQYQITIEGHTDRRPITSQQARFKDNWELSAGRAIGVLHHLKGQGIPENRMLVRAFAWHRPRVVDAQNEESAMAKNRRVTLLIH